MHANLDKYFNLYKALKQVKADWNAIMFSSLYLVYPESHKYSNAHSSETQMVFKMHQPSAMLASQTR